MNNKKLALWVVFSLIALILLGYIGYLFKPKAKNNANIGRQGILGRPLKVGILSWPGYVGGLVANNGFKPNKDCIYFKDYNLLVEFSLVEDVDVKTKLLLGGGNDNLDIVYTTVDFWANESPNILKGGISTKAFLQVDWSKGADAIVVDSSINTVEELANHKIALTSLSPSHWFYEYIMAHSSITDKQLSDLEKNIVGKNSSPDARQDFVANRVDACVVWEPDVSIALKDRKGSKVLISTLDHRELLADLMVTRDDFIKEHPDALQAFVNGWFAGVKDAKANPQNAANLLIKGEPFFSALGQEKTLSILNEVNLTELPENVKMFGVDDSPPIFDKLFREAGQIWLKRGFITDTLTPTKVATNQFIKPLFIK